MLGRLVRNSQTKSARPAAKVGMATAGSVIFHSTLLASIPTNDANAGNMTLLALVAGHAMLFPARSFGVLMFELSRKNTACGARPKNIPTLVTLIPSLMRRR